MKRLLLIFALCGLPPPGTAAVLTNAVDITRFRAIGSLPDDPRFDLTGTVVRLYPGHPNSYVVDDGSGSLRVDRARELERSRPPLQRGDILRIRGRLTKESAGIVVAKVFSETALGHEAPPPEPLPATAREILANRVDNRFVRIRGSVLDVRIDETDPKYIFLMIHDGDGTLFTAFNRLPGQPPPLALIGAQIEVDAFVWSNPLSKRRFSTHELSAGTNEIRILVSAEERRRQAPPIARLRGITPERFTALGPHFACGTVRVVYASSKALLQTPGGDFVVLENLQEPFPRVGQTVKAVGLPQTDLHFVHLVHARWTEVTNACPQTGAVTDVSAGDLAPHGVVDHEFHGKTVRLRGIVKMLPRQHLNEHLLLLECADRTLPVDLTSVDLSQTDIAVGCTVEVTAVCVLLIENWQPGITYSRVLGFTLVPRGAADLTVLSAPPWWTSGRMLILVILLLVALLGFFIWNRILRRLVERRSRELVRAELTTAKTRLRVEERTRLAVELHDSLAQVLTGISMEIETAQRCRKSDSAAAFRHIDTAGKSLKACRNELRNTLWDLRSQALEEIDIDKAIRQTLLPHIRGIELNVRFNVPRTRLSDNALHDILCIIRELAVNAIHHGHADTIFVAGSQEADKLLFSVRDNGCGFDPAAIPGAGEGHYGLVGIRERLRRLGGSLELFCRPGKGAEARAFIRLTRPQQKGSAS